MAKALMIQGTASHVGKSLIVAGLCRILSNRGLKVAPFKSQNMALNSFITKDGGEIGRAQALQAEAARTEPSVDMNPVLLKSNSDMSCQVIIRGKVYSAMDARDYYGFVEKAWITVEESYRRLSSAYDYIVIEGAGSPAEVNIMDRDIANIRVARLASAPVLIVGDIERGGVFASIVGTMEILGSQSDIINGFVINKFRGDKEILRPALDFIEKKYGRPVFGVIPFARGHGLSEEDSVYLSGRNSQSGSFSNDATAISPLKIVVLRLPHISNFTDFEPLYTEPDVEVNYSIYERDIEGADLIIIPGTKNTMDDLQYLHNSGIADAIRRAVRKGIMVMGICGGYQMLGMRVSDPFGIESNVKEVKGIGLLDVETVIEREKITAQSLALPLPAFPWKVDSLKGYEIHMGRTTHINDGEPLFRFIRYNGGSPKITRESDDLSHCPPDGPSDGAVDKDGITWGTYLHGIFENDSFRHAIVNHIRIRKGLSYIERNTNYYALKETAIQQWASIIEENLAMDMILELFEKVY